MYIAGFLGQCKCLVLEIWFSCIKPVWRGLKEAAIGSRCIFVEEYIKFIIATY